MVDEAIWNLASGNYRAYKAALEQGKSVAEAAGSAGGQLAMVHRKIGDYTLKMENLLAESKATISVGECIDKPLEQAVLDIIGNGAMSDSDKDAAVQQLGVIQEWVKHGLQGNITAAPSESNRTGDRRSGELGRNCACAGAIQGGVSHAIRQPENRDSWRRSWGAESSRPAHQFVRGEI